MRMNWEDGPEEWVDEQLGDPEDERWDREENEYREECRDKDAVLVEKQMLIVLEAMKPGLTRLAEPPVCAGGIGGQG